jgi:tetratricopeptide (TPR) repeat protein
VLKEMGRLDHALAAYEETAARFPNNVVVRTGRAEVLKEMGRLDHALAAYEETAARFPSNMFARTGRAEVLKEMDRLDAALVAYEETAKQFPADVVARTGQATVLILLDRVTEARELLAKSNPVSESDWISYHVLAMSYLRNQDYDEAAKRLSYGVEMAPWPRVRRFFETALAVALMRKRDYQRAAEILEKEVDVAEVARRQVCMVLLAHSQAELERRAEALDNLTSASSSANPEVRKLTSSLRSYYGLGQTGAGSLVRSAWLAQEIDQAEFRLALAA